MWDSSKNPPTVHPSNILFVEVFLGGKQRKPWWKCTCGANWQESIVKFIVNGCPSCQKKSEAVCNPFDPGGLFFSKSKYEILQLALDNVTQLFGEMPIRFFSLPHLGFELRAYKQTVNLDCKQSLAVEKDPAHAQSLRKILDSDFDAMPLYVGEVDEYLLKQATLPYDVFHLDYNGGLLITHLEAAVKILQQKHRVILFMTVNKTKRNNSIVFKKFPILHLFGRELFSRTYKTNRARTNEYTVVGYANF